MKHASTAWRGLDWTRVSNFRVLPLSNDVDIGCLLTLIGTIRLNQPVAAFAHNCACLTGQARQTLQLRSHPVWLEPQVSFFQFLIVTHIPMYERPWRCPAGGTLFLTVLRSGWGIERRLTWGAWEPVGPSLLYRSKRRSLGRRFLRSMLFDPAESNQGWHAPISRQTNTHCTQCWRRGASCEPKHFHRWWSGLLLVISGATQYRLVWCALDYGICFVPI